uniref:Uncharacterized protein n=1 Tax=Globisporangium ultimum (strain ATCC 200006 / CBS 805.95 / DAOM BR144) TaxID=431595 RepID=K3WWK7_GLOUD
MAIASAVFIFPIMCRSLALLRYDVASLVVKSYDFWYSNAINTASCVLLGMYLNDVRAIIVVAHWLGNLDSSLADANTMLTRLLVLGSIVGAISDLLVVAYVQFGLVRAANHFVIFRYGSRVVSVEDVIVNGFATISIMLIRNAVRRIIDIKQQKRLHCTLLRCINYRCMTKLRLTEETHSIVPSERPAHGSRKQQQYQAGDKCVLEHMTFVKCESEFDANHTFYPIELNGYTWSNSRRWTIGLIGFAGISVSVVGFVDFWNLAQRRWLFALGLAATEFVYIVLWAMNQTELFRGIITSFDFLFMSFQLTSAHLCICDMFHWDARCLGLLTSWLWMHFVLTADALTPVVRRKIGLQTGHLAVPVLFFLASQVVIVYALLVGRNWDLRDRTMYHITVAEKEIEPPFSCGRVVSYGALK